VRVLPKHLVLEGTIAIVYAERKLLPRQVRALVDWLLARAPSALARTRALEG
jgi:DNA-binding transcriptional LysR family regulator